MSSEHYDGTLAHSSVTCMSAIYFMLHFLGCVQRYSVFSIFLKYFLNFIFSIFYYYYLVFLVGFFFSISFFLFGEIWKAERYGIGSRRLMVAGVVSGSLITVGKLRHREGRRGLWD